MESSKKEYDRHYYEFVQRTSEKPKSYFCPKCNDYFYQWTSWKHASTKKHQYNIMTDEEKSVVISLKEEKRRQSKIKKLKDKLNQLI
jgi:hypothetical protein